MNRVAVALVVVVFAISLAKAEDSVGMFHGRVITEWISDPNGPDRDMRLLEELKFTDPKGSVWTVPAGSVVDGASIPRALWTAAGSPFTGDYRRASVVHDRYCETKEKTWQETHRVFYDAMRADGVPLDQALLFYGAVYGGGPRWSIVKGFLPNTTSLVFGTPEFSDSDYRELEKYVDSSKGLTVVDVEQRVEALIKQ